MQDGPTSWSLDPEPASLVVRWPAISSGDLLIRIGNLAAARKRGRGPAIDPEPFADARSAAAAFGVGEVDAAQLPALGALHRAVVEFIDGLIAGEDVQRAVSAINRLAARSHAHPRL